MFLILQDWKSVDPTKYTISANGGRKWTMSEVIETGTYNMLMADSPMYDAEHQSFESSHRLFKSAFEEGFPWELSEILSGNTMHIYSLYASSSIYMLEISPTVVINN